MTDKLSNKIAGIAGFAVFAALQPPRATGEQSPYAKPTLDLRRQVAIVRHCTYGTKKQMKRGDDLLEVNGTPDSDEYYQNLSGSELRSSVSAKAESFLHCDFRNVSRVALMRVAFFYSAAFDDERPEHNESFPFAVLAPGATKIVWIVNAGKGDVHFSIPSRVRFLGPPLQTPRDQLLEPKLEVHWVLRHDFAPNDDSDRRL